MNQLRIGLIDEGRANLERAFEGDPFNKVDPFIKQSLIIKMKKVTVGSGTFELGQFDIVLDK